MPERDTVLIDTVTLSNFALAGRLDVLVRRYSGRLGTTSSVLDEVARGIAEGHAIDGVLQLTESGELEVVVLSPPQRRHYQELQTRLGAGEASLVAVATEGGTVVTDDRAARDARRERGIPVTGTIGILRASVRGGQLTVLEADEALERMVRAGYYSPVASISSTLSS